jgi:CBS domain-containing protein
MKAIPPIKAVMTPFPFVIDIDAPLSRAREMMRANAIRHLPVVDTGRLVGLLGPRDLVPPGDGADDRRVRDACSGTPAYVVGLTEPLDRVLMHMADRRLDAALVVKDDKLAGIFTASDACQQFGKLLRTLFPQGGDEAA